MKVGETTEEYTMRFNKYTSDAGYSAENETIGDAFLMSFPIGWQGQINTLLHWTYIGSGHWKVEEISTTAINVFNNQTAPINLVGASKNNRPYSGENLPSSKRFKSSTSNCNKIRVLSDFVK